MASKKKALRGFTLIELVIVIAVIAILAALLVPTILGQAEKARLTRGMSEVNEIGKALARIRTDTGSTTAGCYTTLTNLSATTASAACNSVPLCSAPTTKVGDPCWSGPYLAAVNPDPWSNAYVVTYDASTASITVKSNGPDKTPNNTDDLSKTF